MKRSFPLLLASVLALPLVVGPAEAGRKRVKPRVVKETYTATQGLQIGYEATPSAYVGRCPDPEDEPGCVRIKMKRGEIAVTIEVVDATGRPVNAYVWGPNGDEMATICGKSRERISVAGFVDVWPSGGTCWEEPEPSVPTTGTVIAKLYRK